MREPDEPGLPPPEHRYPVDPEGRTLTAAYVAGRGPDGVDRALSPAATSEALSALVTVHARLSPARLGPMSVTEIAYTQPPYGAIIGVWVDGARSDEDLHSARQHALGHVLGQRTGLARTLARDPVLRADAERVSMSLRGWQWEEGRATAYLRAPAELATDLLHAYMGNPAWTRETWPHLAKLVRDHVNDDSRTRHGDSSDDGSGPGRSRSGRWQWRWRWPWRR